MEKKDFKKARVNSQLSQDLTFSSFIADDYNRFAYSAGMEIASKTGETDYNPIFIYGEAGVGKTHLINAIGLKAKELYPDKTVLYVSGGQFQRQFAESVRSGTVNDFVQFYELMDVLILDDIHLLSTYSTTQKLLAQIIDYHRQNNSQVIVASEKTLVELAGTEGFNLHLITCLECGLVLNLHVPDEETRLAIVRQKTQDRPGELSDVVMGYIAKNIDTNTSVLVGVTSSLLAQNALVGREITLEQAKQLIDDCTKPSLKRTRTRKSTKTDGQKH